MTIMHMAHELDAGDIIAQRATPIDPDETVETLHDRLARLGRNCWWRRWSIWPTTPPPGPPRRRVR